jgi:tryptophan synthase alpha chain
VKTIENVFKELKGQGKGALVGYVMAGDPAPKHTPKIAEALINGGIDVLELGLPFSDPIADGPTIQAAGIRALNAGTTPSVVLDLARQIRQSYDLPVVIMSYLNPIFRMGLKSFLRAASDCGVSGTIIPDLPIEEAKGYRKIAAEAGIDTIFLAAPTTNLDRLRRIVACSSGFLYLVSRLGVTGSRSEVENYTIQLVKKVVPYTEGRIPVAVGFGISKPEHAKTIIGAGADGVVLGSVFVDIVAKNLLDREGMLEEIETKAREIKQAI